MKLKFIQAKYEIEFKLPKNFRKILKKIFKEKSNLAVFCAVQFRDKLDDVLKEINSQNYKTTISKAFRTSIEGQILGCDSYEDSLQLNLSKIDGFIYIGDGYFHPNALLLAQENEKEIKPVIVVNVVQQLVEIIDKTHIDKYLKKKKANLAKFYIAKNIGVFVTTKWGQEYKSTALKLKKQYKNKNFYYFISDNFSELELENFPYINCWVNTACPRIGQDDIVRHNFSVVNIKDVFKNS